MNLKIVPSKIVYGSNKQPNARKLNEVQAVPRRQARNETVPASLRPHRAIELLKKQLAKIDEIIAARHGDPKIEAWESTTVSILEGAFGKPNGGHARQTREFRSAKNHVSYAGMPDSKYQQYHVEGHLTRKALLQAYIEQLETLVPPAAAAAPDRYQFHPEIERVSGHLYRDGHYKQAALEAYIRVIDAVKEKSGLPLDGDPLMNQAFGCDSRTPVIRFNKLQSDSERDEQRGLMYLYKGIVGLRNAKAHDNRLFDDPFRAHEYLALASCLMRLLEISEK